MTPRNVILQGDVRERLRELDDESSHMVVTSPPYWGLRDYAAEGQLGLEATPEEYVENMAALFREVRRVLRKDGTVWLNLGDSYARPPEKGIKFQGGKQTYLIARQAVEQNCGPAVPAGLKPKDLVGIPWRVAFALQADGWWLRSDIIWSKPNPMPEPVTDRPTRAHEYIFLLSKSQTYYYDAAAIREPCGSGRDDMRSKGVRTGLAYLQQGAVASNHAPVLLPRKTDKQRGHSRRHDGFNDRWDAMSKAEQQAMGRNKRSVWEVATKPYQEAHFATYPPELIKPCILAGCPEGGIVLDPFFGSGTTGLVAAKAGRDWLGIELNPEYVAMAERRLQPVKARLL